MLFEALHKCYMPLSNSPVRGWRSVTTPSVWNSWQIICVIRLLD